MLDNIFFELETKQTVVLIKVKSDSFHDADQHLPQNYIRLLTNLKKILLRENLISPNADFWPKMTDLG